MEEREITSEELARRMEEAGTDYMERPAVFVTPNQIVAYNMAYFRKAAGLTQEDLGERLTSDADDPKARWSNATVSAAERSWDGKRVRQFDADLIFGLAVALDLPVAAFFLPPEDDGIDRRYLVRAPVNKYLSMTNSMSDWLSYAVLPDPTDDEDNYPAAKRFRERLESSFDFHFGAGYANSLWGDGEDSGGQKDADMEHLVLRAERLRSHYDGLRSLLGDIITAQEEVYRRLSEVRSTKRRGADAHMDKLRALAERYRDKYAAGASLDAIAEESGEEWRMIFTALHFDVTVEIRKEDRKRISVDNERIKKERGMA